MDPICPLLALATDGRSVIDAPDPGHRCHAVEPMLSLDRSQQARVCLTDQYRHCERYLSRSVAAHGPAAEGVRAELGLTSTRLVVVQEAAWSSRRSSIAPAGVPRVAAATAAAVVLAGGGWAVASGTITPGAIGIPWGAASPQLQPSDEPAAATKAPRQTSTPRATLTPGPTPTAEPTPAPTPQPTPQATPVPAPQAQTYVVQQGDTLSSIASRFGTTAAAIQAANGIADPNVLSVGQLLVIP